MWQRFSEKARRSIFFAQEEAGRLGLNFVSTEHLLLGLLRENDSSAVVIIRRMNVRPSDIKKELEPLLERGNSRLGQDMQLTPTAKQAIDLAYDEARALNNNYLGTEHLLLGLVREGSGTTRQVFDKFGVDIDKTRDQVKEMQRVRQHEKSVELSDAAKAMKGKNLMDIAQLSNDEITAIFDVTRSLKTGDITREKQREILKGKTLAMIFEKPSLRTRVSFETGIFQLGGHGIYLGPSDISLGKRESVHDIAQTLGRMTDLIMARVFAHDSVVGLGEHAGVPVINGLSDLEHPCQALADFYTIIEHKGTLVGRKLAFIGDGNNVAHSLMLLAAKVGTNFSIGCPKGYEPDAGVVEQAKQFAAETGSTIEITNDPVQAAKDADVIYTDVWASMGQEAEAEERAKVFADFQVNSELMSHAKPDAIFMHCLPAHRGSEVTDEVIDSPQSVVFDEAENRLHVQKGIMVLLAG